MLVWPCENPWCCRSHRDPGAVADVCTHQVQPRMRMGGFEVESGRPKEETKPHRLLPSTWSGSVDVSCGSPLLSACSSALSLSWASPLGFRPLASHRSGSPRSHSCSRSMGSTTLRGLRWVPPVLCEIAGKDTEGVRSSHLCTPQVGRRSQFSSHGGRALKL
jgi:hypothetical protein